MKKPPSLAVFRNFGLVSLSCRFYVNLPLLHRHWAGIAKVKIKVKEYVLHFFISQGDFGSYCNKSAHLASISGKSAENQAVPPTVTPSIRKVG